MESKEKEKEQTRGEELLFHPQLGGVIVQMLSFEEQFTTFRGLNSKSQTSFETCVVEEAVEYLGKEFGFQGSTFRAKRRQGVEGEKKDRRFASWSPPIAKFGSKDESRLRLRLLPHMTSDSLRDFSDHFLWIIDQIKQQQQVASSVEGGLTMVAPDEGEGETGVFDGTTVVSQRIRSLYGTDPLPGSTTLQWAGEGTALHFFVAKQLDHATVITCPGSTRPLTMVFVSVEFAKKYFYPLHAKWCQDAAVTLSIKIGSSSFINLRSSDGGKQIKSIPQATTCLSVRVPGT